jgi:Tfp pilus assembly protein PilO
MPRRGGSLQQRPRPVAPETVMKLGVRELIFVAVMLGLLGSSYFLVFNKANHKRSAMETEIDRKQKALADLERARVGVDDLKKKVDELQAAITFFEGKLPEHGQMDKVLEDVTKLATTNGLEQRTFKSGKTQQAANYSEQQIEMTLAGDFEGFYVYLQQLEKFERLTRVTKMELSKMNERDGAMEAKLTLSIFFEPDAGGSPAGNGNATGATASAR